MSKESGIAWRQRNRPEEAERSRLWRLAHPGATTEQARAWRAANPEMVRAAELRNQHRRLMKKLAFGPVPKRRQRTVYPKSVLVPDLPVIQRWKSQAEWSGIIETRENVYEA